MNYRLPTILTAACFALALALPGGAQQAASQPSGKAASAAKSAKSASSANQRAADLLNTINKGEIDTGQLMQNHAQSQPVKDFANMLVSEHQDAQKQLESTASQSSINLSTNSSLQKQNEAVENRLKNESGAQADKVFINNEVKDHTMAIRRLKAIEPNVTDGGLKSIIDSSLQAMQKHLDAAKKLQSSGASGQ
jgi:putative membrane protein